MYSARLSVVQPGVLRADHGVIQARRNRMRQRDLAVVVLQQIAVGALQHAGSAAAEARRMLADAVAASAGLDAHQLHGASSAGTRERCRWRCCRRPRRRKPCPAGGLRLPESGARASSPITL